MFASPSSLIPSRHSNLREPATPRLTRTLTAAPFSITAVVLQTCPVAGYVTANAAAHVLYRTALTPPGKRGRLRDAPVAESDEEQAQGRSDWPRSAQAEE
jgi:hypothetical protein